MNSVYAAVIYKITKKTPMCGLFDCDIKLVKMK